MAQQISRAQWPQTNTPSHGLFYMENAGGYQTVEPTSAPVIAADEHQPSCFALEEEKGEGWNGSGGAMPTVNEAKPSL